MHSDNLEDNLIIAVICFLIWAGAMNPNTFENLRAFARAVLNSASY